MPKVLDFGCGNRKRADAIGIDKNPDSQADIVHDLNAFPYPFDGSVFDEIYADNILEHLDDVVRVMEELHRICRPGGLVKIIVPYFRSHWAFVDPTHRHFFTVESFSYFDPAHIHNRLFNYSKAAFRIERVVFNETVKRGFPTSLICLLADKWPVRYEKYLGSLWPLDDLTFYLRVIK